MMRVLLCLLPLFVAAPSWLMRNVQADPVTKETSSSVKPISQEQQVAQLQRHPMSCYVCSTMDYENPADNLCRAMKQQHRGVTSFHTKSPLSQLTLTTSSPIMTENSTQFRQDLVGSNTTIATHQHSQLQQYRLSPPPNDFVRMRPCLEEENFCTIVSIVRIEFVNDNLFSRFWAMERNCSKSCNTGCMLIGERVRLRVCSQCCRSPNCNFGSGVPSSLFTFDTNKLILLFACLAIAFLEFAKIQATSAI